jgi:type VI secretion system protein ImpB
VPNTLTGEGNLQVDLTFESMDDFSPAAIARKVEPLRKLLETRTQLSNLMTYMDGKSGAEELVGRMLKDPSLLATLGSTPNPAAARAATDSVAPAANAEPEAQATNGSDTDTNKSGDEGEGKDDLDSLLDQMN